MAVTIEANVEANLEGIEKEVWNAFQQAPGYGGQRIRVRVEHSDTAVLQVVHGTGPNRVGVFFTRSGDDCHVVGIGKADGKKSGKTLFSSLWVGNQNRRTPIKIMGMF